MKIKIDSQIPCNLFCKGEQKECPFVLETLSNERIQLSVLPAYPEKYSSYTLIVTVVQDKLQELSGGAYGVSWGQGFADINLAPPLTQIRFSPVVLGQKRLNRDLVTLYDDGIKKIMCEGTSFYTFDLPNELENIKFKVRELVTGAMVCVEGNIGSKEYFLALYSNEKEWKIMHELSADKITVQETGVQTATILPTMLKHEKRCFYKPFHAEPEKRTFTPTIKHDYPDELLPYLFFEGVFQDDESVLTLLDDTLPHDLSAIRDFIGLADSVTFPEYSEWDISTVALFDSSERIAHPNLYKIVVEKGKISNIIHLLTCN